MSFPEITKVIIGVDNLSQLNELISIVDNREFSPPADFMSEDPDLVNPSRWQVE